MSVVQMRKIGLVAHSDDFYTLTERLSALGMVQIAKNEAVESAKDLEAQISAIDRALATLDQRIEKKPQRLKVTLRELIKISEQFPLERRLAEIESLRRGLEELNSKRSTLDHEISTLKPYAPLNLDFKAVNSLSAVAVRVGFVPRIFQARLDMFCHELCWLNIFNSDPNGFYCLFISHGSAADSLEAFLEDCDFAEFHYDHPSQRPVERLLDAQTQRETAMQAIQEKEHETRALAEELIPVLEAVRGLKSLELSRANLASQAIKTQKTLFISGWIKAVDFEELSQVLHSEFEAVEVAEIPPDEGEEPPVALKNPPVIEAFEVITDLYGRPRAGMIDPTPFIAPFFPLFFGLCLTDAGYGILMALFAGGMLAFGKLGTGARKFMRFILYSGIATVIIGAMAGGWFGIDLPSMDNAFARALLSVKLFDPLGNAIEFFAASVFLGVLQVSVGFVLSGVIGIREASGGVLKARAGLLALSWIAVTIGAGIFVANYLIPETMAAFLPIGVNSLKFGALGIVVFSLVLGIAGKRGVGSSLGDGLGFSGLYGIVNLFGDLLSYARILALGLSTGVIAGVINIIAKQISSMIPGVGIVFAALLVIVGHVAYTGLSALGAFVHPARLHFVEYFTKFYEAGGEPFEPLERKIDGVEIVE